MILTGSRPSVTRPHASGLMNGWSMPSKGAPHAVDVLSVVDEHTRSASADWDSAPPCACFIRNADAGQLASRVAARRRQRPNQRARRLEPKSCFAATSASAGAELDVAGSAPVVGRCRFAAPQAGDQGCGHDAGLTFGEP